MMDKESPRWSGGAALSIINKLYLDLGTTIDV